MRYGILIKTIKYPCSLIYSKSEKHVEATPRHLKAFSISSSPNFVELSS
jgi:hypothetical protein